METNQNSSKKTIDLAKLFIFLLSFILAVLVFLLVAIKTDVINKRIKDENISLKVPYSFNVISQKDYKNADDSSFVLYYYIHKDYALPKYQVMKMAFKLNDKEHLRSEIYTKKVGDYNALQRHYNYEKIIDHDHYYLAGLVTLIELEDRYLVIDMYDTLIRGEGEVMNFDDIQLELFNDILSDLKIEDNSSQMPEAMFAEHTFFDLEFYLPEYWEEFNWKSKEIFYLFNNEFPIDITIYHTQDQNKYEATRAMELSEKADNMDWCEFLGEYKLGEKRFDIYADYHLDSIVAVTENYVVDIDLGDGIDIDTISKETEQAIINTLFEE